MPSRIPFLQMHTVVDQPLTSDAHGRISCRPLGQEPIRFEWSGPRGDAVSTDATGTEAYAVQVGRYRIEATDATGARADVVLDVAPMRPRALVVREYRATPASTSSARTAASRRWAPTGGDGAFCGARRRDGRPVLRDALRTTRPCAAARGRQVPTLVHECGPARDRRPQGRWGRSAGRDAQKKIMISMQHTRCETKSPLLLPRPRRSQSRRATKLGCWPVRSAVPQTSNETNPWQDVVPRVFAPRAGRAPQGTGEVVGVSSSSSSWHGGAKLPSGSSQRRLQVKGRVGGDSCSPRCPGCPWRRRRPRRHEEAQPCTREPRSPCAHPPGPRGRHAPRACLVAQGVAVAQHGVPLQRAQACHASARAPPVRGWGSRRTGAL